MVSNQRRNPENPDREIYLVASPAQVF